MKNPPDQNVCEERTFKGLFESLAKPLKNFLVYRGSESLQADDLVQDAFIKLWENCKKVVPEKAKSYLYTLASNAFKNEMAHLKVKFKYQDSNPTSTTNIETPEFEMEQEEFKLKLEKAISDMVPTQREVFMMHKVDKMKYAEIADTLEISVKAVEKRMGKAMKHIRSRIIEFK